MLRPDFAPGSRTLATAVLVVAQLAHGSDTELPDDARTSLDQLASPSFIQRDFAARRLFSIGAAIVPRLSEVARGDDPTAASAAVCLLERLALGDDPAAATRAHRSLATLAADSDDASAAPREATQTALRRADRHVVGIVTALGGSIVREPSLAVVAVQINHRQFTDEHAQLLPRLVNLQQLDLRNCGVTDASLPAIATLPSLEFLNLADTEVTAAGLRALAPLGRLNKIVLYRIELSEDDRRWLNDQFPGSEILR